MKSDYAFIKLAAAIFVIAAAVLYYREIRAPGIASAVVAGEPGAKREASSPPAPAVSANPSTPSAVTSPTSEDLRKVQVLGEIFKSRNDNDPRLDSEFNSLSPAAKQLLRDQYRAQAPEKRNERGTVVFLLGRNLSTPEDFAFMDSVVMEAPCLSLADCAHEAKSGAHDEAHLEMGTDVSLNYPQMVALVAIGNYLQNPAGVDVPQSDRARKTLELAAKSPVPMIAQKAQALLAAGNGAPGHGRH